MYTAGSAINVVGVAGLMLSATNNSRIFENSGTNQVVSTLPVTGFSSMFLLFIAFTLLLIGAMILRVVKLNK